MKCKTCNIEKSITFFSIRSDNSKYRTTCNPCMKEYKQKYQQVNREKLSVKKKIYNQVNKVEISNKKKLYYLLNVDYIKQLHKEYRINNVDKIREYNRNYDQIPENKKRRRIYISNRLKNDINYRIQCNYRSRMAHIIKRKNGSKTKDTVELMGCSIDNLIRWIEFQMNDDMDWNNYGTYWEIDHIIPIALFNCIEQSEQDICFNWKNLQPLYSTENGEKGKKLMPYYYFNIIVSLDRFITIFNLNHTEYQGIRATLNWLREKLR